MGTEPSIRIGTTTQPLHSSDGSAVVRSLETVVIPPAIEKLLVARITADVTGSTLYMPLKVLLEQLP